MRCTRLHHPKSVGNIVFPVSTQMTDSVKRELQHCIQSISKMRAGLNRGDGSCESHSELVWLPQDRTTSAEQHFDSRLEDLRTWVAATDRLPRNNQVGDKRERSLSHWLQVVRAKILKGLL